MFNSTYTMIEKRFQWIDICKGLGIFLVLLGHTLKTDISYVYIYSFHMPLFFFLSGVVVNKNKYSWKSFLKNRFNTLVIPYVFFYILTYLYWLLCEKEFRSFDIEWYKPLLGMLYAGNFNGLMDHNGILWFLPCLFIVEVLFWFVSDIRKKSLQILIVLFLFGIGGSIRPILPWCINIAMVALLFFYAGYLLKDAITNISKYNFFKFSVSCILYIIACYYFSNKISMVNNLYGNIVVFIPIAFIGIYMSCTFAKSICKISGGGYLGRNTLIIFALHQPSLRIILFINNHIIHLPIESNILYAIIADFVVILCLIPIIFLYNKYMKHLFKRLYIK